jgi:hypothetical protein
LGDAVKKDKEDKKRRLTLNRETIRRLEDPRLLEQVRGGTSQIRVCTITGYEEEITSNGC